VHDYISNWWPPGHVIGYEHEFVHAVVDFCDAIDKNKRIEPNFYDGRRMEVLEAGSLPRRKAELSKRIVPVHSVGDG
jgi:hypothetical protein